MIPIPLNESRAGVMHSLTTEFARTNPADFIHNATRALGNYSEYGSDILSYICVAAPRMWLYPGGRSFIDMSVNPDSWASSSNIGNGTIMLGAGPMSREETDGVRFLDGQFDYTRNVIYRSLHEDIHFLDAIARRQNTPAMRGLHEAVRGVRRDSNGQRGLSALGSLGFYQSKGLEVMEGEDRTELLAMYAWSPAYLGQFTQFLADPSFEAERQRVGLATIRPSESQALYDIVASVVHDAIG